MFRKWIEELESEGKNDFFDNSVMSVRQWLVVMSVMMVPILNVIILIRWAFADKGLINSNKVNWARASVILLTVVTIVLVVVGGFLLLGWYRYN